METAIEVIWWIGLAGALIATVVILKQVVLILRVLRGIHRLAKRTRAASQGIARNVATAPRLVATTESARGVRDGVNALATAAALLERRLDGLASGGPERGV